MSVWKENSHASCGRLITINRDGEAGTGEACALLWHARGSIELIPDPPLPDPCPAFTELFTVGERVLAAASTSIRCNEEGQRKEIILFLAMASGGIFSYDQSGRQIRDIFSTSEEGFCREFSFNFLDCRPDVDARDKILLLALDSSNCLHLFDGESSRSIRSEALEDAPLHCAIDPAGVYAVLAHETSLAIFTIDLQSEKIQRVDTLPNLFSLEADEESLRSRMTFLQWHPSAEVLAVSGGSIPRFLRRGSFMLETCKLVEPPPGQGAVRGVHWLEADSNLLFCCYKDQAYVYHSGGDLHEPLETLTWALRVVLGTALPIMSVASFHMPLHVEGGDQPDSTLCITLLDIEGHVSHSPSNAWEAEEEKEHLSAASQRLHHSTPEETDTSNRERNAVKSTPSSFSSKDSLESASQQDRASDNGESTEPSKEQWETFGSDNASEPSSHTGEEAGENDAVWEKSQTGRQLQKLEALFLSVHSLQGSLQPNATRPEQSVDRDLDNSNEADSLSSRHNRFLAWNIFGWIISCSSADSEDRRARTLEICFTLKGGEVLHRSKADLEGDISLASISERGVILASRGQPEQPCGTVKQARLEFCPRATWASDAQYKQNWTYLLAKNECVESVAVGTESVVALTSRHLARILDTTGFQTSVISLAGQPAALAMFDTLAIIVTRLPMGFVSTSPCDSASSSSRTAEPAFGLTIAASFMYTLCDLSSEKLLSKGQLSLSPLAVPTWIGFNSRGVPLLKDSDEVLRALLPVWQISGCYDPFEWLVVADWRDLSLQQWPVHASSEEVYCVQLRKGDEAPYPSRPFPGVSLLARELRQPFLGLSKRRSKKQDFRDMTCSELEEAISRHTVMLRNLAYAAQCQIPSLACDLSLPSPTLTVSDEQLAGPQAGPLQQLRVSAMHNMIQLNTNQVSHTKAKLRCELQLFRAYVENGQLERAYSIFRKLDPAGQNAASAFAAKHGSAQSLARQLFVYSQAAQTCRTMIMPQTASTSAGSTTVPLKRSLPEEGREGPASGKKKTHISALEPDLEGSRKSSESIPDSSGEDYEGKISSSSQPGCTGPRTVLKNIFARRK